MLVLTRKNQERIVIGEDVEIIVLAVEGRRVKLGISAPADKRITRTERFDRFALNIPTLETAFGLE
jgi:carbon storage regulator